MKRQAGFGSLRSSSHAELHRGGALRCPSHAGQHRGERSGHRRSRRTLDARSGTYRPMRRYVCARTSGATCFFTVNLAQRLGSDLLVERIADPREAFRETRRDRPFDIDAIVILPEQLHAIWGLPHADFSTRWSLIKARFSRAIAAGERVCASRSRRRERGIGKKGPGKRVGFNYRREVNEPAPFYSAAARFQPQLRAPASSHLIAAAQRRNRALMFALPITDSAAGAPWAGSM